MVPFDIVELYTVANNSVFQFSAKSIDQPFVLTLYGFKYGNQNGIIISSGIESQYYNEIVAHVYTVKQVLNSITYFNSLNVKKVKSPQLICLDKERKTFIEFSDNRAFESVTKTNREYKIWYYVTGTKADNFIPFGNVTIQYRYHEFNESDLSKLKEVIEKYFSL